VERWIFDVDDFPVVPKDQASMIFSSISQVSLRPTSNNPIAEFLLKRVKFRELSGTALFFGFSSLDHNNKLPAIILG
jgi:hypothetical protein